VAFLPDPASVVLDPVAFNPVGVRVGWLFVGSGNPDVGMAVPAVVAGVPGPVGMLVERGRNGFYRAGWWADADYDLGGGEGSEGEG
jgi:hypothetical protein